jgi:hypothetical protein
MTKEKNLRRKNLVQSADVRTALKSSLKRFVIFSKFVAERKKSANLAKILLDEL